MSDCYGPQLCRSPTRQHLGAVRTCFCRLGYHRVVRSHWQRCAENMMMPDATAVYMSMVEI